MAILGRVARAPQASDPHVELWNVDDIPTAGEALAPALAPALRIAVAEVLQRFLPPSGRLLHLGADSGAAAAILARRFQGWWWQPVVPDAARMRSAQAWRARAAVPNLQLPWSMQAPWPESPNTLRADAILVGPTAVADWPANAALAHRILAPGGLCVCITSGPTSHASCASDDHWTLLHAVEATAGGGVAVLELRVT